MARRREVAAFFGQAGLEEVFLHLAAEGAEDEIVRAWEAQQHAGEPDR